jgi:hypothetical protein
VAKRALHPFRNPAEEVELGIESEPPERDRGLVDRTEEMGGLKPFSCIGESMSSRQESS